MKAKLSLLFVGLAISSTAFLAQTPVAAPVPPLPPAMAANPVVWSANQIYDRQSKWMITAAEQMPADKYGYHPTPDQWTFAKIVSHVAAANGGVCGLLSDQPSPAAVKVAETASKPELVAAVKASFAFCDTVMANLHDDKLGDPIIYFRGAHVPRARALIELTDDLEDHYSQMASYLRLNGMLPPSATPKK